MKPKLKLAIKRFYSVLQKSCLNNFAGEVAEWLNAAVLKTVEDSRPPGVRIPPSPQMKFYTYILKSQKFNRYYYGHSQNLSERLKIHNYGKVRSTKAFRPWTIHYFESFSTKSEAYRRELFFKSAEGKKGLKLNNII